MAHSITDSNRFLGINDASRYTSLSAQTLRRFIADGKLTAHRPGGKILIDRRQLDDLVLRSKDGGAR
jgi:excisionase family DNA binding protein